MRIFYSLNDFLKSNASFKKFAVTIGVFDGVHRAHQKIAKALLKKARKRHLSTLFVTFNPHPANVLMPSKKVPLLISLEHRLRLLDEIGFDYAILLRFDKKFSRMSAADFVTKILGRIHINEIFIGSNFFFGKNKKDSLKSLKRFSRIYKYRINVIPALKSSGKIISSTRIRSLILKGNLKKASKLLSRPVTVLGTVIKGHKRGRIIGFPTANIDPHHEAIPPSGVYAVRIKFGNKSYKGILNIGVRPTFRKGISGEREPTIEVHIFDFNKFIYGKELAIIFAAKIREERKFKDSRRLREQIERDEIRAKRILR